MAIKLAEIYDALVEENFTLDHLPKELWLYHPDTDSYSATIDVSVPAYTYLTRDRRTRPNDPVWGEVFGEQGVHLTFWIDSEGATTVFMLDSTFDHLRKGQSGGKRAWQEKGILNHIFRKGEIMGWNGVVENAEVEIILTAEEAALVSELLNWQSENVPALRSQIQGILLKLKE